MDSAFRKMMDLSSLTNFHNWDELHWPRDYLGSFGHSTTLLVDGLISPEFFHTSNGDPKWLHSLWSTTSLSSFPSPARPVSTQSHFSGISGGTFLPKSFIYTSHISTYLHISSHIFTYCFHLFPSASRSLLNFPQGPKWLSSMPPEAFHGDPVGPTRMEHCSAPQATSGALPLQWHSGRPIQWTLRFSPVFQAK